jgi:Mrr N-terminal domain
MMPVIRISDATWERLKGYAKPLEDSPDDVVQRALDALDASEGRTKIVDKVAPSPASGRSTGHNRRAGRGNKLPQKEFRTPLLETLSELGGSASTAEVRRILEPKMAPRLSDADYQLVSSGDPRWWNATCWERNDLVKEGLLRNDSDRGVWELSSRGRALLES